MKIEDLIDKANEFGWSAREYNDEWEFSQYSPAGEDFSFCISKSDAKDLHGLVRKIRLCADSFDPEEHAMMWAEAGRNGVGGVPSLFTLVDDAKDLKTMLNELASAMENAASGEKEMRK